jgi:hypothetical protein
MTAPHVVLCYPFLINKYSSSTTILQFIDERLDFMLKKYYLDEIVIQQGIPGPTIRINYTKIYLDDSK